MKKTTANNGVAKFRDLLNLCQEAKVNLIDCQMTVELFGFDHSEFINNIEYGGAVNFFEFAGEAEICLYV